MNEIFILNIYVSNVNNWKKLTQEQNKRQLLYYCDETPLTEIPQISTISCSLPFPLFNVSYICVPDYIV